MDSIINFATQRISVRQKYPGHAAECDILFKVLVGEFDVIRHFID